MVGAASSRYSCGPLSARLTGSYPPDDLAVIQVSAAARLVPAHFADSSKVQVGDIVLAMGNPPAAKAGLQSGDVITAVNGTATPDTQTLAAVLAGLQPGQQASLSITKADGSTTTAKLTLGQVRGS